MHRFTVGTKERELKLKAESEAEYASWADALAFFARARRRLALLPPARWRSVPLPILGS